MRKVILLLLLAAASVYYWKDRQQVSEAKVNNFLRAQTAALQQKDTETLCAQLSPTFRGHVMQMIAGQAHPETTDRDASCQHLRDFFDMKTQLDRSLPAGSEYGIDYTLNVDRITLSDNKKEAVVDLRTRMNLANLIVIDSVSTDTLRMYKGQVVIESSEGRVTVSGPAAGQMRP